MHYLLALFAQIDVKVAPEPASRVYGYSVRDMILVIGIALVLANILVIWAYFARRNRRRQYGMYTQVLQKNDKESQGSGSGSGSKHRRRRRRHSEHTHRNPTLAEAGGLPPLRSDDELPGGAKKPESQS